MTKQAIAYLRTSSAANVGGDSDKRQRDAIAHYAKVAGIEVVVEFYDAAVSGADPVVNRPGFANMLAEIASNGVRIILVETASRFARDLIVQETGYAYLRNLGISLVAVDDPDAFTSDTPTAVLIRQILGAVVYRPRFLGHRIEAYAA
jgi:DNA invertase Pin-like site-specific DNA recombinase